MNVGKIWFDQQRWGYGSGEWELSTVGGTLCLRAEMIWYCLCYQRRCDHDTKKFIASLLGVRGWILDHPGRLCRTVYLIDMMPSKPPRLGNVFQHSWWTWTLCKEYWWSSRMLAVAKTCSASSIVRMIVAIEGKTRDTNTTVWNMATSMWVTRQCLKEMPWSEDGFESWSNTRLQFFHHLPRIFEDKRKAKNWHFRTREKHVVHVCSGVLHDIRLGQPRSKSERSPRSLGR